MGAIGGLLGLNGGINGTGMSMQNPATAAQLGQAYDTSQASMAQQNSLLNALQAQQGLQKQSDVYGQYQNIAQGQGPNPAQAMLNQATGQNVANQASLMAGQRGAGQNVGLMARLAAQQGANIQQQAAGQGASMQAQQSLGALGEAGNMAGQMAGQQIGQTNTNANTRLAEQQALLGANQGYNQAQAGLAQTAMQGQGKMIGGLGNAIGAGAGMFGQAGKDGGAASPMAFMAAEGGKVPSEPLFFQAFKMAQGGVVPAMVSPGEKYLKPQEAQAVAKGVANPKQVGEMIPGQAKVKGNSYSNDTVYKKLEEGGVVIPRSVMQSKNPSKGAADFVRDVMAKKGRKA